MAKLKPFYLFRYIFINVKRPIDICCKTQNLRLNIDQVAIELFKLCVGMLKSHRNEIYMEVGTIICNSQRET